MFFDIFNELCQKKGVSCKKAATDIGLANSITTKWKDRGSTPNAKTLNKIADYFGVSVLYLLGEKENAQPELSEVDKQLFDIIKDLSNEDKLMMLDMIKTIKDHRMA